jgi:FkbM family methyltransferase
MSFISYAQNYEDVMLWRALRHVERGFYIDVGAWSPDLDSVTRAFSERDWRGINIEPNPRYFNQLIARRPDDINLKIAIGDHIGVVSMNFIPESGLSTANEDFARHYGANGWELNQERVELSTLAVICATHVPQDSDIHFLKIDVEGLERAVLVGNNWDSFRPWVVVIEAMLPNSQTECHEEWEEVVTSAGYLFVYADGLNRYYVAQEHSELVSAFKFPPNVFDEFVTANLATTLQRLEHSEAALSSAVLRLHSGERSQAELRHRLGSAERLLEESQKRVGNLEQDMIASRQRERELRDLAIDANRRALISTQQYETIIPKHQAVLEQYEAILKSTSWRLTAPLRLFATLIPKALRACLH